MKIHYASLMAATVLMVLLSGSENSSAVESGTTVSKAAPDRAATASGELEAVAKRMHETSMQMQADLRKARARLVLQQEAERKKEAEQAQQQAARDAAQLAAIKNAKERQAAEAAQAQARQVAAERAAKAERERQAALEAQRALELKVAKEKAAKPAKGGVQQGEEVKLGVDL